MNSLMQPERHKDTERTFFLSSLYLSVSVVDCLSLCRGTHDRLTLGDRFRITFQSPECGEAGAVAYHECAAEIVNKRSHHWGENS